MVDNEYVVYLHKDLDGTIKYIGSGRLSRANTLYANSNRGKKYKEWVKTYGKLLVEIVREGLTKAEAIQLEIELFELYKDSDKLLNISKPRKVNELATTEELDKLFYYDETSSSGIRWKVQTSRMKPGDVAGTLTRHGYYQVAIKRKFFRVHRIVLGLHSIDVNENCVVDHIDGNRANNSLSNLRVVSQADNARNRKIVKDGKIPVGVRYDTIRDRFIATVKDSTKKTPSGSSVQISKHFLVKKYGYAEALRLAIIARQELLKYIEDKNNVTYSDSHKVIDKAPNI